MSDSADKIKRPASQYYWGDWFKDLALQSCSLPARGLWHEMNCLMHQGEPYGHLTMPNGKGMGPVQLANLCKIGPGLCKKLLEELEENGVFSRTPEGVVFSRRMVRDEAIRQARADGGKAGAEHGIKGAEAGKKGGRPVHQEGGSETPLSTTKKPPPSSSSSSSSSASLPSSLRSEGGADKSRRPPRDKVTLKAYLEACRAAERKPLPTEHPIREYCRNTGISDEMLQVAWVVFRRQYTEDPNYLGKQQRDWPAHFANAVRKRWAELWYVDQVSQEVRWTHTGLMEKANLDARARAREQQEPEHA